jgi:hypothetical protein
MTINRKKRMRERERDKEGERQRERERERVSGCKREKRTAREKERGWVSVMREKNRVREWASKKPETELKKGKIKRWDRGRQRKSVRGEEKREAKRENENDNKDDKDNNYNNDDQMWWVEGVIAPCAPLFLMEVYCRLSTYK